jgi:hypothetical protein
MRRKGDQVGPQRMLQERPSSAPTNLQVQQRGQGATVSVAAPTAIVAAACLPMLLPVKLLCRKLLAAEGQLPQAGALLQQGGRMLPTQVVSI